jgi:hypothetical protein
MGVLAVPSRSNRYTNAISPGASNQAFGSGISVLLKILAKSSQPCERDKTQRMGDCMQIAIYIHQHAGTALAPLIRI